MYGTDEFRRLVLNNLPSNFIKRPFCGCLHCTASSRAKPVLALRRLWHEMTLLATVGLQSRLQRCVCSGADIPPGSHWFSASEGRLVRPPINYRTIPRPPIPCRSPRMIN